MSSQKPGSGNPTKYHSTESTITLQNHTWGFNHIRLLIQVSQIKNNITKTKVKDAFFFPSLPLADNYSKRNADIVSLANPFWALHTRMFHQSKDITKEIWLNLRIVQLQSSWLSQKVKGPTLTFKPFCDFVCSYPNGWFATNKLNSITNQNKQNIRLAPTSVAQIRPKEWSVEFAYNNNPNTDS